MICLLLHNIKINCKNSNNICKGLEQKKSAE